MSFRKSSPSRHHFRNASDGLETKRRLTQPPNRFFLTDGQEKIEKTRALGLAGDRRSNGIHENPRLNPHFFQDFFQNGLDGGPGKIGNFRNPIRHFRQPLFKHIMFEDILLEGFRIHGEVI